MDTNIYESSKKPSEDKRLFICPTETNIEGKISLKLNELMLGEKYKLKSLAC